MTKRLHAILPKVLLSLLAQTVALGDCAAESPLVLDLHKDAVYDVVFSPLGPQLASSSYDETIRLWRVSDGAPLGKLTGHTDQVFRIAFSPAGQSLASCSGDGTIIIWDLARQTRRAIMRGHGDPILGIDYSPDGQRIATAGSHIQVWQKGRELWATPHQETFFSVAWSPDQQLLACGTRNLIQIHHGDSSEPVQKIKTDGGMVYQLCYSPDGNWLASAASDGSLTLRRTADYRVHRSVTADHSALFAAVFAADGKSVITGGRERVIRRWRVPELTLIREWRGPEETILSVALSADLNSMAAGSYDGKVFLWRDIHSGETR